MAASYQTGISSSPTNLLQTLVTWLNGQGWTTDLSAADGALGGWRAHLHKGALYVNLRSAHNEKIWNKYDGGGADIGDIDWDFGYGLGLYVGTGYTGGLAWDRQPGGPTSSAGDRIGAGMNLPNGAVAAYHFFDDGNDHVTVVVEKSPSIFVHMGWGPKLVRTGTSEDFWYFFGSSPAAYVTDDSGVSGAGLTATAHSPMAHSFVHSLYVDGNAFWRVDATTWANRWVSNAGPPAVPAPGSDFGWTGRSGRCALNQSSSQEFDLNVGEYVSYKWLRDRAHQSAFTGVLFLPLHCFVKVEPAARWATVGWPPTVFYSTATAHGFTAGQIVAVGGLNYMVFPNFAVRKAA